ncbi:hypothetical protein ColTof4_14434 [Colletotrichum tofieldiae]|nr:hypothetical protein ColTof3_14845 [Colletotrichum tofieldiae]GKT82011.1 hypothetical protein ColTof4_14434 [Colletotrichum tofieldiae]
MANKQKKAKDAAREQKVPPATSASPLPAPDPTPSRVPPPAVHHCLPEPATTDIRTSRRLGADPRWTNLIGTSTPG